MGKKWRVTGFIFFGFKITVDGDCSHEFKRLLLLGRKSMTNLDNILKKQRYYFADKGPNSKNSHFSTFSKSGLVWVILIMHVDFLTILLSPHCVKEAGRTVV